MNAESAKADGDARSSGKGFISIASGDDVTDEAEPALLLLPLYVSLLDAEADVA